VVDLVELGEELDCVVERSNVENGVGLAVLRDQFPGFNGRTALL
jgi:hypothetical protein